MGGDVLEFFYTPSYYSAWPALVGLSIFQLVNGYRIQFSMLTDGINRPNLNLYINIGTAIGYLPVAILLGLRSGLIGVIIATVVTEFIRILLYIYYLGTDSLESSIVSQITPQVMAAIVMGGFIYLLQEGLQMSSKVGTLLLLIGGVAIYLLTLLLLDGGVRSIAQDRVVNRFM